MNIKELLKKIENKYKGDFLGATGEKDKIKLLFRIKGKEKEIDIENDEENLEEIMKKIDDELKESNDEQI